MLRLTLVLAALLLPPVAARADPDGLCGLEDATGTRATCPRYVTYDEEGGEVSGSD